MTVDIKLNGVAIKTPTEFSMERYVLTKAGRLTSGKMTAEVVARKRKFLLRYSVIKQSELEPILQVLEDGPFFFTLEFPDRGEIRTATVYAGAVKNKIFQQAAPDWLHTEVEFDLIEQ